MVQMNIIILFIIGISVSTILFVIFSHDAIARSNLANESLKSQANSTNDCFILHLMADNHKDDWFKDEYVKIAEKRLLELKCK